MTDRLDHGIVNLPLDKRGAGSLDAQIDREIKRIKAEKEATRQQSIAANRERDKPVPFTREELRSAQIARVKHGWYAIAKVNRVSVTLHDPHYGDFREALDRILEVKS